jgi:hypothetical protein
MTAQPEHQPHGQDDPHVWNLTLAGHAALDRLAAQLADAIDTSTPESIADGLAALYVPDLYVLFDHVQVSDEDRDIVWPARAGTGPYAPLKPHAPGVVWADGFRQQLPGWWPHYPDEGHRHHRSGFWTRDGEQLVLTCCGIDGT